jgi:hypothetical protein
MSSKVSGKKAKTASSENKVKVTAKKAHAAAKRRSAEIPPKKPTVISSKPRPKKDDNED